MTTGKVIVIIIILTVIIITIRKIKSKPPQKKKVTKKVTKSTTGGNNSSSNTNAPTQKDGKPSSLVSKIIGWCIAIMAIAIAIIIISAAINAVIKMFNNPDKPEEKQYRMVLVVVDSITVYFDGNLKTAKENRIDPIKYDGFEFAGATEPFCIYNAEGDKFCGEKGSDSDMGNSTANRVLRFVSQNGEKGKITIKFLKKQKILVN